MENKNYLIYIVCIICTLMVACQGDPSSSGSQAQREARGMATGNPAIDGLTRQIEETPDRAALYAARGEMWYQNENYDEGIADLEKAISLDSSKAEYFHVLADMYLDYYRSRQALNTMKAAAEVFPERIPTLLKLAEYQLILEQHSEALFTLERIRMIDPQNAEMYFMFGSVFRDMGRTDEAINAYQTAVENDPDIIDAWIILGDMLAEKNVDLAERYYENALRIDSSYIEAIKAKARFLANYKNDLAGSVDLYHKINSLNPQYEEAYYDAGLVYLDMDSLEQAYKSFDIAVNIAPQFAEAWYHRGVASELMGKKEQALSDYRNVLNLNPDFEGAKAGVKRLNN